MMDAVKFLKEQARMCEFYEDCKVCPMGGDLICANITDFIDRKIAIVEKWSKEHPAKTRMSEFLKQFPNAHLTEEGVIDIHPCTLDKRLLKTDYCTNHCSECREKYWLEEVE